MTRKEFMKWWEERNAPAITAIYKGKPHGVACSIMHTLDSNDRGARMWRKHRKYFLLETLESWKQRMAQVDGVKASPAYWVVTVKYQPGLPQSYKVLGAPTYQDAEDTVLRHIGYHPGVPLSSVAMKGDGVTPEYPVLNFEPLTQAEKEMIRFND